MKFTPVLLAMTAMLAVASGEKVSSFLLPVFSFHFDIIIVLFVWLDWYIPGVADRFHLFSFSGEPPWGT